MTRRTRLYLITPLVLALFFAGRNAAEPKTSAVFGAGQLANLARSPELVDDDLFQQWYWFYHQRVYPLEHIPEGAMQRARQQVERFQAERAPESPLVHSPRWVNIGPAPVLGGQIVGSGNNVRVTGRVRDIDVDPTNANHWLIASDGGGVWETRDAGATWKPLTDHEIALSTGAVAFAPSDPNIIYAGVGSNSGLGIGILKSTNGGDSWQLFGASTFSNVSFFSFREIKVHPTNPSLVLAASWCFFGGTPATGIFRSTDGGASWSQRLMGTATEFETDPGNFNNMYAGIRVESTGGDASLNGVYRSTDAGDTWQLIGGPWGAITNGGSSLELAIAPSNHNTLYVSFTRNQDGAHHWRTNNAWAASPSWSELPVNSGDFSNYQDTIVDPANPDILYAGGFALLFKFTPAFGWQDITTGMHVDQIAMAWVGNRLLVGNDGGMWSTSNGGSNWINYNSNLSITQFYQGSVHPTKPNFALGASQDNGTEKWTRVNAWSFLTGGDGNANAISSSNPDTNWVLSFCCGHGIVRTTDGGNTFAGADSGIDYAGAPFVLEFEKCPNNDNVFIAGTDNLWRTNNLFFPGNTSWSMNGPEMRDGGGNSDSITAMAFAAGVCNTYAFGTGSGQLRLTTDDGNSWRDIDINNAVPNRYITDLAFHPLNPDTLFVTLSGLDEGTPGQPGHVFRTTNARSAFPTWSNIGPLVNIAHNALVIGPSELPFPTNVTLFAGTDLGVFKSTNDGGTWTIAGIGLPNMPVLDLQVNNSINRVIAFTYGRGAFALLPHKTDFDFDIDTRTDVGVWRPSTGAWFIINSSDGSVTIQGWGVNGDKIVPGDYDGDGKTDTAIWRPSTGAWFITNSSDGSTRTLGWGAGGDVPVPADYDGDGKTDIAVWRPSNGLWFIIHSSDNSLSVVGWGVNGDVPVPGDYDGDSKSDVAVWRSSTGTWYIIDSSNNAIVVQGWGVPGDRAVAADYDGDGKTDIAIWRPSTGAWFIINSLNGSIGVQGWGVSTDVPTPGDYDGDGKTDIAVWRPSNGTWFIVNSSNGSTSTVAWGVNGDMPLPSAFIGP